MLGLSFTLPPKTTPKLFQYIPGTGKEEELGYDFKVDDRYTVVVPHAPLVAVDSSRLYRAKVWREGLRDETASLLTSCIRDRYIAGKPVCVLTHVTLNSDSCFDLLCELKNRKDSLAICLILDNIDRVGPKIIEDLKSMAKPDRFMVSESSTDLHSPFCLPLEKDLELATWTGSLGDLLHASELSVETLNTYDSIVCDLLEWGVKFPELRHLRLGSVRKGITFTKESFPKLESINFGMYSGVKGVDLSEIDTLKSVRLRRPEKMGGVWSADELESLFENNSLPPFERYSLGRVIEMQQPLPPYEPFKKMGVKRIDYTVDNGYTYYGVSVELDDSE